VKGIAEFSAPSSKSPPRLGRISVRTGALRSQGRKNTVAPPKRSSTSDTGPNAGAEMRMNMYEEPQIAASDRKRNRSTGATYGLSRFAEAWAVRVRSV